MALQRFFIGAYNKNSGMQTNIRPWAIPDEAFSSLRNAYVFRGRVRKRFGSQWFNNDVKLSRLRIQVDTITSGSCSGNVGTNIADSGFVPNVGQAFSVGDTLFTVFNISSGAQQMLRTDGSVATATYDISTGNYNITMTGAADTTPVYIYPGYPVMGLLQMETNIDINAISIAFDTRYAYQYSGGWQRLNTETNAGDAVWTGSNSQFFWATTWTGDDVSDLVFFVTNFNQSEPNFMRYLIGTTWTTFNPQLDASPGNYLNAARMLVVFKNRLVALNTWEGTSGPGNNYRQRARYSALGSPLASDAWRDDIPGNGNAVDAATTEAIISSEFVKDRLIVYFESSTWELAYTGNQATPFVWQKINTELGAEATFSIVPFDKVCVGIGNVGIHACNGSNVERIDEVIPDEIFNIHYDDSGLERVYGIRDYYSEMVYWTFPDQYASSDQVYPNRILAYNYRNQTWAFFDDSITCFGYYQASASANWGSTQISWSDGFPWDSGSLQAGFKQVVAGNQEGFTFICLIDEPTNAAVLQITNISYTTSGSDFFYNLNIIDHNLRVGEYIYIENGSFSDSMPNLNGFILKVDTVVNSDNIKVVPAIPNINLLTGTYLGGGLAARVSQIEIVTKQYNFFAESGRNAYIPKVDFMVDSTDSGQIQVDYYVSTNILPLLQYGQLTGSIVGTGILETFPYYQVTSTVPAPIPFELNQERLWHPVYFQADGEIIQFNLNLNQAQMFDVKVRQQDFQLHAICIYAEPTSSRFQ